MQLYLSARRSSAVYDGIAPTVRHFPDATVGVVVAVGLVYALPAQLVFPPLTTLGRPGVMIGLALALWWALTRLHPTLPTRGRQPVRWAVGGYLATLGASYIAAEIRGMQPLELNSAGRTLILELAGVGVLLATADGVLTRDRIDTVLRWFSGGAAVMAAIALGQYVLKTDLTVNMKLPPLLRFHRELVGFDNRGADGFFRVAGTAGHYIEFSVLMVLALLVSIHLARFCDSRRDRQIYGAFAMVQASVIPIALSRTGIIALGVAIALLLFVWPLRTSFNILVMGAFLAALIQVAKPGTLGTLKALLFAGSEDPSVQGRLEDYEYVAPFIRESLWFGRGVGTFIPELYQLLDNQWLLTLVSSGVVGVTGLAMLCLVGIVLAGRVRRFTASPRDRDLSALLAVGIGVAAVSAFTFDALFFSTYLITLHLFIGLAGAVWRVTRAERLNLETKP